MAVRSLTVPQIYWQIPHPTQVFSSIATRNVQKSIEIADVGHLETQALHPFSAVQRFDEILARPILTSWGLVSGTRASVSQD